MFMDDYTDAQIAPTGNFGRTEVINCDNPMLSDQQRDLVCTSAGLWPDRHGERDDLSAATSRAAPGSTSSSHQLASRRWCPRRPQRLLELRRLRPPRRGFDSPQMRTSTTSTKIASWMPCSLGDRTTSTWVLPLRQSPAASPGTSSHGGRRDRSDGALALHYVGRRRAALRRPRPDGQRNPLR